ncbi:MAG: OsmC family peroxiredoxin, partial [Bacteroidetes bacterium]|nr:OsmC family peroxiredoxin [Bacteroidota bacterium]
KLELNLIIDVEIDEKLKTILDRVARTCPVSLSLHPEINQNITINIKSK